MALVLAGSLLLQSVWPESRTGLAAELADQPLGTISVPEEREEDLAGLVILERSLFDYVNVDRISHDLTPLTYDDTLVAIARARAAAQVGRPELTHFDSSGAPALLGEFLSAAVRYQLAGENLARLVGPDSTAASRAHEALMNSPSHRRNILKPGYGRLVVGAVKDATGRIIFAQIFHTPPDSI